MKKFKLIKEYPGSPKLGFIINSNHLYHQNNYIINGNIMNPSKYPEFWEEIVEKNFEILSINIEIGNQLCKKQGDYFIPKHSIGKFKLDEISNYKIYSVKRLSDGEVFTVGDKIDSTISDLGRATELTGFKIIDNKLTVGLRHLGYYPLATIILPKKPLFTTEDGVDIFEGDKVYWQNPGTGNILHLTMRSLEQSLTNNRKYFSSKEAAEDHVLMNKPCLSINDVKSLRKNEFGCILVSEKDLKDLLKSRLDD